MLWKITSLAMIHWSKSDVISLIKFSILYFKMNLALSWSDQQCFTSLLLFCLANWREGLAENHRQFPDRLIVLEFARAVHGQELPALTTSTTTTALDPSSNFLSLYLYCNQTLSNWMSISHVVFKVCICLTIFNQTYV